MNEKPNEILPPSPPPTAPGVNPKQPADPPDEHDAPATEPPVESQRTRRRADGINRISETFPLEIIDFQQQHRPCARHPPSRTM